LNTQTIPPVVLMGVSGSGKTTVGEALAKSLAMPFIEADDLHPKSNRDKMAAGIPLTDDNRWPWLDAMGEKMEAVRQQGHGVVATCSALKRVYRDRLRGRVSGPLLFVLLDSPQAVIAARMADRRGHFRPPALLDSQFATLEIPGPDEHVFRVSIDAPADAVVDAIIAQLPAGTDRTKP
jgi:gluconokinase